MKKLKLLIVKVLDHFDMDSITEKQVEYINILSDYDYFRKEDEIDIAVFLKEKNKKDILELSKRKAPEKIGITFT